MIGHRFSTEHVPERAACGTDRDADPGGIDEPDAVRATRISRMKHAKRGPIHAATRATGRADCAAS